MDVAYDYAIQSADKRIEFRFSLQPYADEMPMKNLQFSWVFFQTAIIKPVPLEHFNADEAKIVVVGWNDENNEPDFFGNGYRADIGDTPLSCVRIYRTWKA